MQLGGEYSKRRPKASQRGSFWSALAVQARQQKIEKNTHTRAYSTVPTHCLTLSTLCACVCMLLCRLARGRQTAGATSTMHGTQRATEQEQLVQAGPKETHHPPKWPPQPLSAFLPDQRNLQPYAAHEPNPPFVLLASQTPPPALLATTLDTPTPFTAEQYGPNGAAAIDPCHINGGVPNAQPTKCGSTLF